MFDSDNIFMICIAAIVIAIALGPCAKLFDNDSKILPPYQSCVNYCNFKMSSDENELRCLSECNETFKRGITDVSE